MREIFYEPSQEELEFILSGMPSQAVLERCGKKRYCGVVEGLMTITKDLLKVRTARDNIPFYNFQDQSVNVFNGVRALCTPKKIEDDGVETQLIGIEYFGVNRYIPEWIDIADIRIWVLYKGGNWKLNPASELDIYKFTKDIVIPEPTNSGEFLNGLVDVNGVVLDPQHAIDLIYTLKDRFESDFTKRYDFDFLKRQLHRCKHVDIEELQKEDIEKLQVLGLLDEESNPTYIWRSLKWDHLDVGFKKNTNGHLKSLRENGRLAWSPCLGPHGPTRYSKTNKELIESFYEHNDIISLIKKKNPSKKDIETLKSLEKEYIERFGFSIRGLHCLRDWPIFSSYELLDKAGVVQ